MEKLSFFRSISALLVVTGAVNSLLVLVIWAAQGLGLVGAWSGFGIDAVLVELGRDAVHGLQWGIGVVSAFLFGIYGLVAVSEVTDRLPSVERRALALAALLVVAAFSPSLVVACVYFVANGVRPQIGQLLWLVPVTALLFATAAFVGRFHMFTVREEIDGLQRTIDRTASRIRRMDHGLRPSRLGVSLSVHAAVACVVGVVPIAVESANPTAVVIGVYAVAMSMSVVGTGTEIVAMGGVARFIRSRRLPPFSTLSMLVLTLLLVAVSILLIAAVFVGSGAIGGTFLAVVVVWLVVGSTITLSWNDVSLTLLGDVLMSSVEDERKTLEKARARLAALESTQAKRSPSAHIDAGSLCVAV